MVVKVPDPDSQDLYYLQQRVACSFHVHPNDINRRLLIWFGLRGDLAKREFIAYRLLP